MATRNAVATGLSSPKYVHATDSYRGSRTSGFPFLSLSRYAAHSLRSISPPSKTRVFSERRKKVLTQVWIIKVEKVALKYEGDDRRKNQNADVFNLAKLKLMVMNWNIVSQVGDNSTNKWWARPRETQTQEQASNYWRKVPLVPSMSPALTSLLCQLKNSDCISA